jgi:hypothetical protein
MAETRDNTIEGLCARVTDRLGADYIGTWDKCQVETAVVDAMWMLSIVRPGLFTSTQEISLAHNECVQTLPDECRTLSDFTCIVIDGKTVPVHAGDFATISATAYHPPSRRKRIDPAMSTYHVAVNPNNPRSFAITPMIQPGQEATLFAECVSIGEFADDICAPLPEELRPYLLPLVELALYQLYSTDREAPEVAALANASLNAFMNITAVTNAAVNAALRAMEARDG